MDQNVKNKISTIESPNSEKKTIPLVNFTQVISFTKVKFFYSSKINSTQVNHILHST